MLLVSLRWLGTLLLALTVARRTLPRDWRHIRSNLFLLCSMGALGFTVFNALFYVAAHYTTAISIGIIQGSIPVFVLVGAFLVYRIPSNVIRITGVALTLGGVVIVAGGGELDRLATLRLNRGDVFMVVACVLYSGYALALRRCPPASPLSLFTVFAAAAFLSSLPLAVGESLYHGGQWPGPRGWIIIGLITVFPSFLAHLCFIKAVAMIGPGRAGVFFNLVPVFAAVFAVFFLGEVFEAFHAIALALVVVGIAMSEWRNHGRQL